ncbi:hypothetical protein B0O44_1085 [Pedobacter nutrimenti]|uniref:Uncharacterized protein n=1 Tax=Pedobacter nutrimenti TaxID=1241337 RepID=A0A318UAV1_9SPHI|nr:hypothetical protein B0O44_1085 [Pedobacter nutrimenti]
MNTLDRYFKKPLLYDYLIAIIFCMIVYKFYHEQILVLPKSEAIMSMASDLTTISLTLAGFILTLLTVLITFKSGSRVTRENYTEDDPLFDIFFASEMYFKTVSLLKNCVKSLIFITVLGYSLKILLPEQHYICIYFFNIVGLIIIVLTLWRSLLILTKIINLQRDS